jgi:hypothetical protein
MDNRGLLLDVLGDLSADLHSLSERGCHASPEALGVLGEMVEEITELAERVTRAGPPPAVCAKIRGIIAYLEIWRSNRQADIPELGIVITALQEAHAMAWTPPAPPVPLPANFVKLPRRAH